MKQVKDSIVFMDDAAAECLHWHGGLKRILDSGAVYVDNFSPFVKSNLPIKKVVFILMSPLLGETWKTIDIILQLNKFKHCTIVSSLPSRCHSDTFEATSQVFLSLENQLFSLMQSKAQNSSATVFHVPIFPVFVSQNLFMMPAFSELFSVYKCSSTEMNMKKTDDVSIRSFPIEMQSSVKHLAYSLSSLMDTFQVKGDYFSLGPLSHILCSELENISHQQKKSYSSKASVVIVDRLLDLAGPLSQSYETMLDKILLALPHFSGHTFDVAVPMYDLTACKSGTVYGRPLVAPGCLAHKDNSFEESVLNAILFKKPREALTEVNRSLVECASKEGVKLDLSSRLTPEVMKQRTLQFKSKHNLLLKCNGLLQQVLAIVEALNYSNSNSIDNLSAIEKALLEYLALSPEDVLNNIMQMISEKDEMNYKMDDILTFLAFFYMLSGETKISNESAMQATLMEEFFQDKNMNELISLFIDSDHVERDEYVLNTVRTLFDIFKRLGALRKRLKGYSSLFKSTNPAFPASYNPLLKQLLQDIFDPSITDIPDLEFHSAGLRDYIKTGFSLFMNVTKPQPRDNSVIFVIVLGGVTPSEIKLIQEISAQEKETQIILGSTCVLTPRDVLKNLGSVVKELVKEEYEDDIYN
ncbi:sec1 family domain-containing protein 2 [Trichonephila clavata]|uniref:Sec1 family domain-containing protein 2 n=1 Tax=Trichonephila clavata TaxID=2740835 RepID=A0A8X6G759_TRICU|nr:sec1 family domain-containing protein 2 [Trichonephila clavata]